MHFAKALVLFFAFTVQALKVGDEQDGRIVLSVEDTANGQIVW